MLYDKRHIYLRSPLRISFAGGGTDMESFYLNGDSGHVISSTIDLYNYVSIKDMFDSNVRVHHAEIETESITSRIKHNYSRIALEHFGIFKGIEVILTSDVMTTGSGLGASSSMMSSLILGCSVLRDNKLFNKHDLAELNYKLELEAGTSGGKQDQYATVFGGFNSITFDKNKVALKKVKISGEKLKMLEERIFLVFTNMAREIKEVQVNPDKNLISENKRSYFTALKDLSYEFLNVLESKTLHINEIGKLLEESWKLKKSTNHQSSNPFIDQLYEALKKKGVTGGKVLGAGGGGFLLAFAKDPKVKEKIKYELYPNFIALDIKFSFKGTEILWKNF
jgi:D-glycero-alpha-D-manno-heptose-7-phosphate kinase